MELNQIRYFLTLSRELNFTRAAEACHVGQPALTRAIRHLEEELGGELFRRERGNTHLSELGRLVLPHMAEVLEAAQAAQTAATGYHSLDTAVLRLGVMCTVAPHTLVAFLRALRERLPGLELVVEEHPGPVLLARMLEGDYDLAVLGMPALPERLDMVALYTEAYGVAFGAGHRFEARDVVPARALIGEPYVERPQCEFDAHWDALDPGFDLDVDIRYRSEREEWAQAMLAAGLGCAVLPESLPRHAGVTWRALVEPGLTRTIGLVTLAGRRHSPVTRVALEVGRALAGRKTSLAV